MANTGLMEVKNEYLTYEDIYKGIHDDENNVCDHFFVISATCPLF